MSNKVFQQNLDDKKGPQPGGPYLIQMLFKEPVEMPDKEKMTAIMEKHIGSTEGHHVVGVYRGNGNQRPERALAAGAHGGFRIHGWPCCDRSRRGVLLVL